MSDELENLRARIAEQDKALESLRGFAQAVLDRAMGKRNAYAQIGSAGDISNLARMCGLWIGGSDGSATPLLTGAKDEP